MLDHCGVSNSGISYEDNLIPLCVYNKPSIEQTIYQKRKCGKCCLATQQDGKMLKLKFKTGCDWKIKRSTVFY